MVCTVIGIIMAHSLRSLAGFCMGSMGKLELERNIYITTLILLFFEKWHFVSEPEKIKLKF